MTSFPLAPRFGLEKVWKNYLPLDTFLIISRQGGDNNIALSSKDIVNFVKMGTGSRVGQT